MQSINKENIRHENFMAHSNREVIAYQFDDFTIDLQDRRLKRQNEPLALTAKAFDILILLVENNGRVVEKSDLLNRVWPETFVEEINLNVHISYLRKALGESAAQHQYIETVPKRGYRFTARIETLSAEPEGQPTAANQDEAADQKVAKPAPLAHFTPATCIPLEARWQKRTAAEYADEAGMAAPDIDSIEAPLLEELAINQTVTRLNRRTLAIVVAAVVGALLIFGIFTYIKRAAWFQPPPKPFQKTTKYKLTSSGKNLLPALSPDGEYVAYVQDNFGKQSLWVMQTLTKSGVQVVAPAEVVYGDVRFAPDGQFIYYGTSDKRSLESALYQIPVLGGNPRKVLDDIVSHISFSPDGSQFAFVRGNRFRGETSVVAASADGSEQQVLLTRKRPEMVANWSGVAWSPDGKQIACAIRTFDEETLTLQLMTITVADRKETPLGQTGWENIGQLAWVKDAGGPVFTGIQQGSPMFGNQLWHLSYPAGTLTKLTDDLVSYEGLSLAKDAGALVTSASERVSKIWIADGHHPDEVHQISSALSDNYSEQFGVTWMPDGRIVYGSYDGNSDIWMMNADGSRQRRLSFAPTRETSPVVTPDGRHIIFVSKGAGASHLWRMESNGGNPEQLTDGPGEFDPAVSPDGRWIVYNGYHSGIMMLWKIPADGGEPTRITREWSVHPQVSPDGKQIAYLQRAKTGDGIVTAVMPFADGEPMKIFDKMPIPDFLLLRWSPDGRALHYINTIEGVSNIWSQPIDGSSPRQLTHFKSDNIFRFAWSPDGKLLALDRGVTLNDIVLIRSE